MLVVTVHLCPRDLIENFPFRNVSVKMCMDGLDSLRRQQEQLRKVYWGLRPRAVPLARAVDVLAVLLGEHSGRVGLKSGLCSESCVPGVGLHQWEELIFLIHTKSCVVQWQLCPLSCLLCPQVPRSVWHKNCLQDERNSRQFSRFEPFETIKDHSD